MVHSEDEWDAADQDCGKQSRLRGALSYRSKEVGGYQLGRTLGKGSCAVVKLGTHSTTGNLAAIKILKPRSLREQKEALRETEALQRLNHPNIIKMEQVIRENGYTCLILELGTGGELFEYIMNNGKLHEDEARSMFRQLLSGVQYCHAHLVAHRDLKPENLLLDENGNIKISDFGLSNVIKPGRLFSTWCGSPVYTPPEVVLRQQYNGIAMDIWSLGVILYVIVTGGMPWRLESNVVRNIDDLIKGNYEIPDFLGVSDECRDLIGMMLIADSNKRATLDTIMNHKWVCMGFDGAPEAQLESKPVITNINEDILLQLEGLGYDLTKARKAIKTDPKSPALTAYHHLYSKQQRAQKVNSCQPSDAALVASPSVFLHNITRTRSKTYPVAAVPQSPLRERRGSESIARSIDSPKSAKNKQRSGSGLLGRFFDKFKRVPSKPKESITMAVSSCGTPSPSASRRM